MDPTRQRDAVLRLRRAILKDYSYRDLRGMDWWRQLSKFGPRLRGSRTAREFAREAAALLGAAKDIHLWLRVRGEKVPTWKRRVQRNISLGLLPKLVPGWREHGSQGHDANGGSRSSAVAASGRFADGVVYLCLRGWPGAAPGWLQPAYRALREAAATGRGLIIDVRANGGGSEPLAGRFAGCFVTRPVCYGRHLTRRQGRFFGPFERWLRPNRAGPHYAGRVAVLIGPGTVSSCESFALMMRRVPGCKLIGQPTAGASGNPKPADLGNGVVVFVPSWQDLDLDGTRLEGRGVYPDIEVGTQPQLFAENDPVLDEALNVLRHEKNA